MPRRDGTGPMGRGAMTGRGCGVRTDGYGKGLGLKSRGSYGCKRGFGFQGVTVNSVTEIVNQEQLAEQKDVLEKRLEIINKQLEAK